jgi:predicted transcriptional regulator
MDSARGAALSDEGGALDPVAPTRAEQRLRVVTERLALTHAFGEQVRARRKAADLSMRGLAERCRVPVSAIGTLEAGRGGEPGLMMILIVCDGLAITADMLLGELPTPQERRARVGR